MRYEDSLFNLQFKNTSYITYIHSHSNKEFSTSISGANQVKSTMIQINEGILTKRIFEEN